MTREDELGTEWKRLLIRIWWQPGRHSAAHEHSSNCIRSPLLTVSSRFNSCKLIGSPDRPGSDYAALSTA